jgi:hypothetical protein
MRADDGVADVTKSREVIVGKTRVVLLQVSLTADFTGGAVGTKPPTKSLKVVYLTEQLDNQKPGHGGLDVFVAGTQNRAVSWPHAQPSSHFVGGDNYEGYERRTNTKLPPVKSKERAVVGEQTISGIEVHANRVDVKITFGLGPPDPNKPLGPGPEHTVLFKNVSLFDMTARDVIDRGIQAAGGHEELNKQKIMQIDIKAKSMFGQMPYTATITRQLPRQFKNEMHMEVQGKKTTRTQVINGDQAWVGQTGEMKLQPTNSAVVAEMQEIRHEAYVTLLTPLLDSETYKLTLLDETLVKDKWAFGVNVASNGHKDIQLYFDKASGLLVKIARRTLDTLTMTEHLSEAYRGFKEVDGAQWPVFEVRRDGQSFAEGEVVGVQFFDRLDDSVFAKPAEGDSANFTLKTWHLVAAGVGLLLAAALAISLIRRRRATSGKLMNS